MKSAQEILSETERRIKLLSSGLVGEGSSVSYKIESLESLKGFILSGECEHEWRYMPDKTLPYHKCTKCGVTR